MTLNPESTQFGEEAVTPEEKTAKVRGVFDSVADQYDIMNDLMSGGIHRHWKNHLIRRIRPKAGLSYLDVAGGTGDIAFRIKESLEAQARKRATPDNNIISPDADRPRACAHGDTKITLCDLNWDMLRVGRDRAVDKGWLDDFDWVTGNAECLPLPSNSIDVYTIAFGLRNVTRIDDALHDAFRVLKPGGRFFCLEFSHVQNPVMSKLYDGFSFGVIPKIGEVVAKDRESYQYLVESIRKFPDQEALKNRMEKAGFTKCRYENLSFGIACIHYGIKI
jgi:demethylmenaquinone methyltransferase/2-methoxy-6-polyprenyl-1,4-benzoquinol methylase